MSDYRYFSEETDPRLFTCSETGEKGIQKEFVHRLDELRDRCGFPFIITSGYRSPRHSEERSKPGGPGTHAQGIAADIAVENGWQRAKIIDEAGAMGFSGRGASKTFVHVDDRDGGKVFWTYD